MDRNPDPGDADEFERKQPARRSYRRWLLRRRSLLLTRLVGGIAQGVGLSAGIALVARLGGG